ncbi:hypothetical protein ACOSP7_004341 [Xanthoceras sorbifolium]
MDSLRLSMTVKMPNPKLSNLVSKLVNNNPVHWPVTETTQKVKKCVDNAPVLWKMLKKQKMVKLELETERVNDEKKRVNGDGGSGGGKDENKGVKGEWWK